MRGTGSTKAEIAAELRAVNSARCVPPLDESEVERVAASATRYRPGAARTHPQAEGATR
jgi:putative DNA primase/helicase